MIGLGKRLLTTLDMFFRKTVNGLQKLAPGVFICITIALATSFISDHYGGPILLYALLFGMTLHFLSEEGRCVAGIEFSARIILRIGVALLGVRITLEQIVSLGGGPIVMAIVGVVLTILMGGFLAKLLGLHRDLGILTGGAVAICGASAALALAAIMPREANSERNTILTVVGVTTLSTVAMVLYPLIVSILGLTDQQAGVFLGGTIHDVAQVVGAGYMISDETGDVATFVKLIRVAMLVPVVMCFMFLFRTVQAGERKSRIPRLPGFLVVFMVLVIVNSMGAIPASLSESMIDLSRWLLVTAIAALGIKTSFQKLAVVGWKPVILMVAETIFLLIVILAFILTGGANI